MVLTIPRTISLESASKRQGGCLVLVLWLQAYSPSINWLTYLVSYFLDPKLWALSLSKRIGSIVLYPKLFFTIVSSGSICLPQVITRQPFTHFQLLPVQMVRRETGLRIYLGSTHAEVRIFSLQRMHCTKYPSFIIAIGVY